MLKILLSRDLNIGNVGTFIFDDIGYVPYYVDEPSYIWWKCVIVP